MRRDSKAYQLAFSAVTVAVAMILSFVESRIPAFLPIPGIKIGLANMVTVFVLYRVGPARAAVVSFIRILLSALLFGSLPAMIYSFCGGALSLGIMALASRWKLFSPVGVSALGGVFHNIGQIFAAWILLGSSVVLFYLPALLISGTLSGVLIGVSAGILVRRTDIGRKP